MYTAEHANMNLIKLQTQTQVLLCSCPCNINPAITVLCQKMCSAYNSCYIHSDAFQITLIMQFVLILYIPVNNFSVMCGPVFLGGTSTKQRILMCLAQGHNAVPLMRL